MELLRAWPEEATSRDGPARSRPSAAATHPESLDLPDLGPPGTGPEDAEAALAMFDAMEASLAGPAPAESPAEDPAPAPVAAQALPAARTSELRLDTSAIGGEPSLELSVASLPLDARGGAHAGAEPSAAVAFDRNRPVFRGGRSRPVKRSALESLRIERAREKRCAAALGAIVFASLVAALATPTLLFVASAALAGAIAGASAQALGGGVEMWASMSLAGAAALLPFATGPIFFALGAAMVLAGAGLGSMLRRRSDVRRATLAS